MAKYVCKKCDRLLDANMFLFVSSGRCNDCKITKNRIAYNKVYWEKWYAINKNELNLKRRKKKELSE